jgi:hypothetical protein
VRRRETWRSLLGTLVTVLLSAALVGVAFYNPRSPVASLAGGPSLEAFLQRRASQLLHALSYTDTEGRDPGAKALGDPAHPGPDDVAMLLDVPGAESIGYALAPSVGLSCLHNLHTLASCPSGNPKQRVNFSLEYHRWPITLSRNIRAATAILDTNGCEAAAGTSWEAQRVFKWRWRMPVMHVCNTERAQMREALALLQQQPWPLHNISFSRVVCAQGPEAPDAVALLLMASTLSQRSITHAVAHVDQLFRSHGHWQRLTVEQVQYNKGRFHVVIASVNATSCDLRKAMSEINTLIRPHHWLEPAAPSENRILCDDHCLELVNSAPH